MRDLVEAYSIFPNLGTRAEPYLIERVDGRDGDAIYEHEPGTRDALDPAVAYVIHSLMRGVVVRGTAARLNQYGLGYVAGKTGTTNNYRDAWFIGYVPDLLTAVWVGFDDGRALRVSSGEAAIPVWAEYMRRAPHSRSDLNPPEGVRVVEVEAATGRLWHDGCGPSVVEVFLTGTEPSEPCTGIWDGQPMFTGFEEPMFITEEQWAEWARQMAGMQEVQVIEDPEAMDTSIYFDTLGTSLDTADFTPTERDSVVIPPILDSTRIARPPRTDVRPRDTTRPRVTPPTAPPRPLPPPPPPTPIDSVTPPVDSLSG